MKNAIRIETIVHKSINMVWEFWTLPIHIKKWNKASDNWHTTIAENDLKVGGRFLSRMEAKDGSLGFDFKGTYTAIEAKESISYVLDDDRKVTTNFTSLEPNKTQIVSIFEAETINPIEMQKGGWQAILDNFKKYTEA